MNIGTSSSGINFAGLASGIDSNAIVTQYMRIENLAVQRVQSRQQAVRQQLSAFGQFKSQLRNLSNSAGQLATALNLVQGTASISNAEMAKVEAGSGAAAGNFTLRVNKLAQAHKISSEAKPTDTALGYSGTFRINEKSITVTASDTMAQIAAKIQSAATGATATVINNGTGSSYLALTAGNTGIDNAMRLEDTSGDILVKLGVMEKVGGTNVTTTRISNESLSFPSSDASLSKILGLGGSGGDPAARVELTKNLVRKGIDPVKYFNETLGSTKQTLTINGRSMAFNMDSSMEELADQIFSELGYKAKIETSPAGKRLVIEAPQGAEISDTSGILNAVQTTTEVGATKRIKASAVVLAAQDAEALVDGILVKSATNKLEKAVNGLTITLLKADPTKDASVTVEKSFTQTQSMMTSFVDNFNSVAEFISQATSFDKETYATAALFGNSVISQVEGDLNSLITSTVPGLTGKYKSLVDLGVTSDGGGKVKFDSTKLEAALREEPEAVKKIFQATGEVTGDGITYVSSTDKTKVSNGTPWNINITQVARKASRTVGNFNPTASGASIVLSGGGLSSDVSFSVAPGTSKEDAVRALNNDARLNAFFEASLTSTGELKIESKRYGAAGNFTWTPSWTGTQASVTGQDVAGTINGEAATGAGQFLTGNKDNATTEGLQLMISSTQTGAIGTLKYSRGIGALLQQSLERTIDSGKGVVTSNEKALQDQIDDFDKQIKSLQERAVAKEALLRAKFNAMEQAIAAAQSQGNQLSSVLTRAS